MNMLISHSKVAFKRHFAHTFVNLLFIQVIERIS